MTTTRRSPSSAANPPSPPAARAAAAPPLAAALLAAAPWAAAAALDILNVADPAGGGYAIAVFTDGWPNLAAGIPLVEGAASAVAAARGV